MHVRKATWDDIDSIVDLNRQIGEYHHANAPTVFRAPSAEEKVFFSRALADDSRLFLVAEFDEKVVGFLTGTVAKNELIPYLAKEFICRISTVVVDQHYRGRGIGSRLMSACESWAFEKGAKEVRLEVMEFNQNAKAFYNETGYRTQSRILVKALS